MSDTTIRCAKCGRECEPVNESDTPVTHCVECAPISPPSPAETPDMTQANCANRTPPAEAASQSGTELPASFGRFRPKRIVCPCCGGSWKDGALSPECPVAYSHHLLRDAPPTETQTATTELTPEAPADRP